MPYFTAFLSFGFLSSANDGTTPVTAQALIAAAVHKKSRRPMGRVIRVAPRRGIGSLANGRDLCELVASRHRHGRYRVFAPVVFLRGQALLRCLELLPGDALARIGRFAGEDRHA